MKIVLWIDDLRDPPMRADTKYMIARSVNQAKALLELAEKDAWEDKIDYIFVSKDIKILSSETIEIVASDHFPIICDIKIQGE